MGNAQFSSTESASASPPSVAKPGEKKNDREYQYWLSQVRTNGWQLSNAPEELRADKYLVMEAAKNDGRAIQYASKELCGDKQVVVVAVQNRGAALRYASIELRGDKQVVLTAVKSCGYALEYASKELRNNKQIVLAAVQQDGSALQYANNEKFRNNIKIVMAAVQSNPDAIKYANESVKRDPKILVATNMFDKNHDTTTKKRQLNNNPKFSARTSRKIALSTRFSLKPSSHSAATNFTSLLKNHEYIKMSHFKVYAPNAFDKSTCDPNWTDFNHPCRGTYYTCQFEHSLKVGRPTNNSCWRYSFRRQLIEAKDTGGFMLQLVEGSKWGRDIPQQLGNGQQIEHDMAHSLGLKIFQVYRPKNNDGYEITFQMHDIEPAVTAIQHWYDDYCKDMSDCVVRISNGCRLPIL